MSGLDRRELLRATVAVALATVLPAAPRTGDAAASVTVPSELALRYLPPERVPGARRVRRAGGPVPRP